LADAEFEIKIQDRR